MERRNQDRAIYKDIVTLNNSTDFLAKPVIGVIEDRSADGVCIMSLNALCVGDTFRISSDSEFYEGKTAEVIWSENNFGFFKAGLQVQ